MRSYPPANGAFVAAKTGFNRDNYRVSPGTRGAAHSGCERGEWPLAVADTCRSRLTGAPDARPPDGDTPRQDWLAFESAPRHGYGGGMRRSESVKTVGGLSDVVIANDSEKLGMHEEPIVLTAMLLPEPRDSIFGEEWIISCMHCS